MAFNPSIRGSLSNFSAQDSGPTSGSGTFIEQLNSLGAPTVPAGPPSLLVTFGGGPFLPGSGSVPGGNADGGVGGGNSVLGGAGGSLGGGLHELLMGHGTGFTVQFGAGSVAGGPQGGLPNQDGPHITFGSFKNGFFDS